MSEHADLEPFKQVVQTDTLIQAMTEAELVCQIDEEAIKNLVLNECGGEDDIVINAKVPESTSSLLDMVSALGNSTTKFPQTAGTTARPQTLYSTSIVYSASGNTSHRASACPQITAPNTGSRPKQYLTCPPAPNIVSRPKQQYLKCPSLELTRDARNVLTDCRQLRSATPPPPGTENESDNDIVVVKVVTNPSIPKPFPFEEDPHGFPMPNLTMKQEFAMRMPQTIKKGQQSEPSMGPLQPST
jgi:hypothetical protein